MKHEHKYCGSAVRKDRTLKLERRERKQENNK
jgi:hypothetical protein